MNKQLNTIILIICFLGTSAFNCVAQKDDAELKGNRGFRVTLANKWTGPELFVKSKKGHALLKIHQQTYTRTFRSPKKKPIELFIRVTDPEGEEIYKPYLQFEVNQTMLEPLVVLHWNEKDKKGGGMLIEYSPKKFPYGTYMILNLSNKKLVGYIGNKKHTYYCEPYKTYVSKEYKNKSRIPITAYISKESKPSLVFSTLKIHSSRMRHILFLTPEKTKLNRIVLRSKALTDSKQRVKIKTARSES